MMKKITTIFIATFLVTFALCLPSFVLSTAQFNKTVYAVSGIEDACNTNKATQNSPLCQTSKSKTNPVYDTLAKVTSLIAWVSGVVAVIIIIYGGFRYVVSYGSPEKAKTATYTITYAVIGLVVIIAAQTIVVFILNRLKS